MMAFARWEVSEAWKKLKVKSVSKMIAVAKINIESKQRINEKLQMEKSVKIALINVFLEAAKCFALKA